MTIYDVLSAVMNHPYPIERRMIDYTKRPKKPTAFIEDPDNDWSTYQPIPLITVDVRKIAQKALESYIQEDREQREKYNKLYEEFEQFKKEHRDFVQFKRWKGEGY